MGTGLFQKRVVLLVIGQRRIIKDKDAIGMAIVPEGLIVFFDRLADVPKPVCGDNKRKVFAVHGALNK